MKFIVTVDDSHRLKFSEVMRGLWKSFLQSCKPGQALSLEIKRLRPNKSHQQVKMIWGLLIESIKRELDDRGIDLGTLIPAARVPHGIPCPREVIMSILYATCNDVGDQGERKTLSKMDIAEAGRFFEKCRNYVAGAFELDIPDPDPRWQQKAIAGTGKDEPQRAVSQLNRAKDGPACT